jgi:hypothetical protein
MLLPRHIGVGGDWGYGAPNRPEVTQTAKKKCRDNAILAEQTAHAHNRLCKMMHLTITVICTSHVGADGLRHGVLSPPCTGRPIALQQQFLLF